jgi:DNA-binding LytR/AlgR family response regulator
MVFLPGEFRSPAKNSLRTCAGTGAELHSRMAGLGKVIILDDEPDIGEVVHAQLTVAGYTCQVFTNAPGFFSALEKEVPDVIICDISMPGIDGIELRHALVQNHLAAHCAFVFLTARADSEHRTRAWQAQADAYITKPFTRDELVAVVNNVRAKVASRNIPTAEAQHIFVPESGGTRRVLLPDISYITVVGDYSVIYTTRGKVETLLTLTQLEKMLPAAFVRIHKSYIVSAACIDRISRSCVRLIDQTEIPIGEKFRANLHDTVKKNGA